MAASLIDRSQMPRASNPRRMRSELWACQSCAVALTDDNWHPSNKAYGRYICKPCWNARQKKYAGSKGPEYSKKARAKQKLTTATWSEERKEQDRRRRYGRILKKNYGISIEDFDLMYESQAGKCAICSTEKPRGRGGFHVDHCHTTGVVRKLLCSVCNMMLGMADDKTDLLQKAIDYLNSHSNNKDLFS